MVRTIPLSGVYRSNVYIYSHLVSDLIYWYGPLLSRISLSYKYRQASDFWYLTGFEEPDSAVVLRA